MTHTSSSSETISEELQYYYQDKSESGRLLTRKSFPSHSTSSGVSSARSSELCPLMPPCVTPTPSRVLSPDHRCVTPSSSSSSPAMTPRGGSPEHYCVTATSSSTCEISAPLRGLSPEHCFVSSSSTSSPGVTPRQRSPATSAMRSPAEVKTDILSVKFQLGRKKHSDTSVNSPKNT